jgi:Glycosyl hydrolase catalytic core
VYTFKNYKKILIASLIFYALILGIITITYSKTKKIQFGVNGHPLSSTSYDDIGISKQLDLLVELGVCCYRFGILQNVFDKSPGKVDLIVREATKRNIKLLPILIPDVKSRMEKYTPKKVHAESEKFARSVVSRYKNKVHEWELDNELFAYALLRKGERSMNGEVWKWGTPEGSKMEEYENSRFQLTSSIIKGLYKGVKSADSKAVTLAGDGWLHYGYIDLLLKSGKLPFDKLSWHWYSEMGSITNVNGKLNLIDYLKRYKKPIIITEINLRGGSMNSKENEQSNYIKDHVKKIAQNSNIEGIYIYELLDQPILGINNAESYYGLAEVSQNSSKKWFIRKMKKSFFAYKSLTKSHELSRQ